MSKQENIALRIKKEVELLQSPQNPKESFGLVDKNEVLKIIEKYLFEVD